MTPERIAEIKQRLNAETITRAEVRELFDEINSLRNQTIALRQQLTRALKDNAALRWGDGTTGHITLTRP